MVRFDRASFLIGFCVSFVVASLICAFVSLNARKSPWFDSFGGRSTADEVVHVAFLMFNMSGEVDGNIALVKSILQWRSCPIHFHYVIGTGDRSAEQWIKSFFASDQVGWDGNADDQPWPTTQSSSDWLADKGGYEFPYLRVTVHEANVNRDVSGWAHVVENGTSSAEIGVDSGNQFKLRKLLLLPEMLDSWQVKHAILLDCCDLIFQVDIRELWRQFDRFTGHNNLFGMVPEMVDIYLQEVSPWTQHLELPAGQPFGYNTGVILMDIDAIRKWHFSQLALKTVDTKFHEWQLKRPLRDGDQGIVVLFFFSWFYLPKTCGEADKFLQSYCVDLPDKAGDPLCFATDYGMSLGQQYGTSGGLLNEMGVYGTTQACKKVTSYSNRYFQHNECRVFANQDEFGAVQNDASKTLATHPVTPYALVCRIGSCTCEAKRGVNGQGESSTPAAVGRQATAAEDSGAVSFSSSFFLLAVCFLFL